MAQPSFQTPLFAAAAALSQTSAVHVATSSPGTPAWLNVGSTFIAGETAWHGSLARTVDSASDGDAGNSPDDAESDEGTENNSDPFAQRPEELLAPATRADEGSAKPEPPPPFITDRTGDRDQARFQRMYAGDTPAYHAPPSSARHRPVGIAALRVAKGARSHRVHIIEVPEGVGSGLVRPALSAQDAAAARSSGGVWAQVVAEKAAAKAPSASRRNTPANRQYFHAAAATALGDANSRAAAALGGASGVHLSEDGNRLAALRRGALSGGAQGPAETNEIESAAHHPEDASRRLARIIAEGYARQGVAGSVALGSNGTGQAEKMDLTEPAQVLTAVPRAIGFIPLMPAIAATSTLAAISLPSGPPAHASTLAVADVAGDEVISAARAPWETESGYAARRLRQLHALARVFPSDQRVWRTLVQTTLSLQRHCDADVDNISKPLSAGQGERSLAAARVQSARRVAIESALAVVESALSACRASVGSPLPPQQLLLDRLCLICALHGSTDPGLCDVAWRAALLPNQAGGASVVQGPQPRLWVEYLLWFRGTFALFSMVRFRERVRDALQSLAAARELALQALSGGAVTLIEGQGGVSSSLAVRLRLCDAATLDVLTLAAATEAAAGYPELGLGLWQAIFEFNVNRPRSVVGLPHETAVRLFAGFWDSEYPRIGDVHPSFSSTLVRHASDSDLNVATASIGSSKVEHTSALYFTDVASAGWRSWHNKLVSRLTDSERISAGLQPEGARKRRFNAIVPPANASSARPDDDVTAIERAATAAAFVSLSDSFATSDGLAISSWANRNSKHSSSELQLTSKPPNLPAEVQAARTSARTSVQLAVENGEHQSGDSLAVSQAQAHTERIWGSLGWSELLFESLSDMRAAELSVQEKSKSDAVSYSASSETEEGNARQRSDCVDADLASALFRSAASKTSHGAHASASAVPPGFVSFYSPLHGYRIVVPARTVDAGTASLGYGSGTDPSVQLMEAAGSAEAYRRALLNASTDRIGRAAAAAAAARAAGATPGASAAIVLPSSEPSQAAPEHALSRWLRSAGGAADCHTHLASLRLLEVNPEAYASPSAVIQCASGVENAPMSTTESPADAPLGSGWVTVERDQASHTVRPDPATACALASAARLALSPHAYVPFAEVRHAAVAVGAQMHRTLAVRFLDFLGVRIRSESGSSRSTTHALCRVSGSAAVRPVGGSWAASVLQSTAEEGVRARVVPSLYAGHVADIGPEAVQTPAAACRARRVLHRVILPQDGVTPATAAPTVNLFRAALIDFEAAAAIHASSLGTHRAYETGRRAVRAILSIGSLAAPVTLPQHLPSSNAWSPEAQCGTGVDEWIAYSRFESAFGRHDRATTALSAMISQASRLPPGPAACSPSVALVALELIALSLRPKDAGDVAAASASLISLGLSLVPASLLPALVGSAGMLSSPVESARAALRISVNAAVKAHIADVESAASVWIASVEAARRGAMHQTDESTGTMDALFAAALTAAADDSCKAFHDRNPKAHAPPRRSRWGAYAWEAAAWEVGSERPQSAEPLPTLELHAGFTGFAVAVSTRVGLRAAPAEVASHRSPAASATVLGIAPLMACAALFTYFHGSTSTGGTTPDIVGADALFRRCYVLLLSLVRTLVVARLRVEGAYVPSSSSERSAVGGEEAGAEADAQAEEDIRAFVPALERWLAAAATPAASRLSARLSHLAPVVFASGRTVPATAGGKGGSLGLSTAELRSAVLSVTGGLGLSAGYPDPLAPLDAGLADSTTVLGATIDALLSAAEWLMTRHVSLLDAHAARHAAPPRLLRQSLQLAATAFPGNLSFLFAYLDGRGWLQAFMNPAAVGVEVGEESGTGGGWGALSTQAHVQGILGQWGADAPPEPHTARFLIALRTLARLLRNRMASLQQHNEDGDGHSSKPQLRAAGAAALGDVAAATAAVKRLGLALLTGADGATDWASQALVAPSASPAATPTSWRALLRGLLLAGEPPSFVVRTVFLRATHACPWSRSVWLDLLARLRQHVVPAGAAAILQAASDRGVNIPSFKLPLPESAPARATGSATAHDGTASA